MTEKIAPRRCTIFLIAVFFILSLLKIEFYILPEHSDTLIFRSEALAGVPDTLIFRAEALAGVPDTLISRSEALA